MAFGFQKKAFVISPIGGQGDAVLSDERGSYANRVFTRIIERACDRVRANGLDVLPIRGDHDPNGDIMMRILDGIVQYEFVIALLTDANGYNPNVYWEVGAAQALGRPVLLLKRNDGEPIPFDLRARSLEIITYDDRHISEEADGADPMAPGGPAQLLADKIVALAAAACPTHEQPFKHARKDVVGGIGGRNRFMDYSFEELSRILLNAEREIVLCGTTMLAFAEPANNRFYMPDADGELTVAASPATLLAYQVSTGVDVRILMNAPDHPVIPYLLREQGDSDGDGVDDAVQRVNQEIAKSQKLWMRFATSGVQEAIRIGRENGVMPNDVEPGQVEIILLRRGAAFNRILFTDKIAVLSPNFVHALFNTGPCIEAKAGTVGYAWIRDELQFLADQNRGYDGPPTMPKAGRPEAPIFKGMFGLFGKKTG